MQAPCTKELARLAEAGVLVKGAVGNQVQYRANRNCPIFEELAKILRKTSGVVDVLADALAPIAGRIDTAFVFGSMASGKEPAGNDVDVLVIGDATFSEVANALYPAQDLLQREINPKVYRKEEWKQMKKNKDAFVKEVMAKPTLFILGTNNDLGEPGGPKP